MAVTIEQDEDVKTKPAPKPVFKVTANGEQKYKGKGEKTALAKYKQQIKRLAKKPEAFTVVMEKDGVEAKRHSRMSQSKIAEATAENEAAAPAGVKADA